MAGKAKSQSKADQRAAQRAERLAEAARREKAQQRRRNLMVGGVVAVVLVLVGLTLYAVSRTNDVDASAAGASDYGLAVGPAQAPHQVVVYEDFLCPACGEFEIATGDELARLAAEGQVLVDYRPFILLDRFGDYSARSAGAFGVVLAESGPEVAKEFHDLLFADQPAEDSATFPDADWLVDKAVEAGAVEADVRPGIEEGANDFARGATREAVDAGVSGTPTILLDGEVHTGTADELLAEIEE